MVNRKRNFTLHFYLMAALTTLALGAVNYIGMEYRTRVDLTGDQRFTLSEGTQRLFEKLTEPINIKYYVDEEPPSKRINLERDVLDKLEELSVSSGGKLQYTVERITNEEVSDKRSKLEEKGILSTRDLLTTGSDDRAELRGVQGYYSSIEVRYGLSESKVINGVVNLVDQSDEAREHRVDTLEFDIAYAVLTMGNDTQRPSLERLLKSRDKPARITAYISNPMADEHAELASNLETALDEIANVVPSKIEYQRIYIEPDGNPAVEYPYVKGAFFRLSRFASALEPVMNAEGEMVSIRQVPYYTHVVIQLDPDSPESSFVTDFSQQKTIADIRTVIEDRIWEGSRTRTRLGFVLPPHEARFGERQPGGPPLNGHTRLMQYIQAVLSYETEWIDIQSSQRIPRDLACLIVMEPNKLSERELYEIEQFLIEGGNVMMLVQRWKADLNMTNAPIDSLTIQPQDMDPTFVDWAKYIGIEFGDDLLLQKNAAMRPFRVARGPGGQQSLEHIPSSIQFAPRVAPEDLNQSSVYARALADMPLPFVVEEKLNVDRIAELGLEQIDLIRLQEDVYRFIPANPVIPAVPLQLNLDSISEVEKNADAKPSDRIRAQKLGHRPLVATVLSGQFPSFWADQKRNIPDWNGDLTVEEATPAQNPAKGNLLVMSSAGTLDMTFLNGYSEQEAQGVVIPRGLNLYRNVAEAFIYGEDLVSLRARTGIAPRIVGPVEKGDRVIWFMICIAGVPVLLLMLGGARSFIRGREREDYEIGIGIREDSSASEK